MGKQTAVATLREAIHLLELQQEAEREILKEQLKETYESLKLVNLIKSSVNEITSSVELKNGFFELAISLLSGYLTKKMMVRAESKSFVKILGILIQYGVTSLVAQNTQLIKNLFSSLVDTIFKTNKEKESESESPSTEYTI
ncbi:MAG: hypothetical protein WC384_03655 [Prolixibacteraceae bacterium]|jgi:hypothetical protein